MLFQTANYTVRPFLNDEVKDFAAYHNDLTWMQYQGFKNLSITEYQKVLLAPFENLTTGYQFAIVNQSNTLVGDVYLQQEGPIIWLGYTVAPTFARQGIMQEIVNGVLTYFEKQPMITTISAGIDPANEASRQLLIKQGFAFSAIEDDEEIYVHHV